MGCLVVSELAVLVVVHRPGVVVKDVLNQTHLVLCQPIRGTQTIEPDVVSNLEWIELWRDALLVLQPLHSVVDGVWQPLVVQRMLNLVPDVLVHPGLVVLNVQKDVLLVQPLLP